VRALFWIEGWAPAALKERAGVEGSIGGLRERGLFVGPPPFNVAERLAQDDSIRQVLIAYHPPGLGVKPPGGVLLPEVAKSRKSSVEGQFEKRQSDPAWAAALERLQAGEIQFVARCLRQDPSTKADGSHLFDRLVDISQARKQGRPASDLDHALEALAAEFFIDRSNLLVKWQQITGKLCALDIDLNALEVLLQRDAGADGTRAAAQYLREMLAEMTAQRLEALARFLQREMAEVQKLAGGVQPPDLGPILGFLGALGRIGTYSPAGTSRQDIEELLALASADDGFSRSLWGLSKFFSELVQQPLTVTQ